MKNKAASALARLRWAGKSSEERKGHARKMALARWEQLKAQARAEIEAEAKARKP